MLPRLTAAAMGACLLAGLPAIVLAQGTVGPPGILVTPRFDERPANGSPGRSPVPVPLLPEAGRKTGEDAQGRGDAPPHNGGCPYQEKKLDLIV